MTVWLKPVPHDWHAILTSQPGGEIEFLCWRRIPYVADAPTATDPPALGRCPECTRIAEMAP